MKKLVFLLVLVVNIVPVLKEGRLSLGCGSEAVAQGYGTELYEVKICGHIKDTPLYSDHNTCAETWEHCVQTIVCDHEDSVRSEECKEIIKYDQACLDAMGGGTGINQDCNHEKDGTAYWDNCNECVGGTTGKAPCSDGGGGGGGDPTPTPTPTVTPTVPCPTSAEDIMAAYPNTSYANAQKVADLIDKYSGQYGIDTDIKLQHFIAQACHELGDLNSLIKEEGEPYFNFQVSTILRCWPTTFSQTDPTKRDPDDYAGTANFHKLLNFIYAQPHLGLGNGNESSGDGYKYRGRGPFQLTGKKNYKGFQDDYNKIASNTDIDLVSNPDLLLTNPDIAIQSAMWYYKKKVLDKIDINNASVEKVTYKINTRAEGLPSREAKFSKAKTYIDCNN
ncbi:MAG TPA: glycoside hydrolase family 19 protein [Paludibacter sp.]|nr:glycoside hydrolase family 19 protein [Paludibacter sp.]